MTDTGPITPSIKLIKTSRVHQCFRKFRANCVASAATGRKLCT